MKYKKNLLYLSTSFVKRLNLGGVECPTLGENVADAKHLVFMQLKAKVLSRYDKCLGTDF